MSDTMTKHEVDQLLGYSPCVCGNLDGTWHPVCYHNKSQAEIDSGYRRAYAKARRLLKNRARAACVDAIDAAMKKKP
jgi:hypothetical protein